MICPHIEGGKNWTPSSYNPASHRLFVAIVESCMNMTPVGPNGHGILSTGVQVGLQPRAGSDGRFGRLEAVDLVTKQSVWMDRERAPLTSGTMATAGGLVFAGYMDRRFIAFDEATGKQLWSVRLNEVPNSNSITYEVDGEQYIAEVVGMGGNHSRLFTGLVPEIKNPANRSSTVWVFKLPSAAPSKTAATKAN
jgi:alcohol dehydrogenase (cytochrome c)